MLSPAERQRLTRLFPADGILPPEQMASLMETNYPAVARRWLEEEGLLDEPLDNPPHQE